MALKSKISVLIISASKTLYKGEAYAISSENDLGSFDVLQAHERFISLIQNRIIVYKNAKEKQEFPIKRGVLTVNNNDVRIYVGF